MEYKETPMPAGGSHVPSGAFPSADGLLAIDCSTAFSSI